MLVISILVIRRSTLLQVKNKYLTPLPTVTGEDATQGAASIGFNVITPLEATISRSLAVEGGPNSDIISEFDGPVVFTINLLLLQLKVLKQHVFLQGDATVSRKQTIGLGTLPYLETLVTNLLY